MTMPRIHDTALPGLLVAAEQATLTEAIDQALDRATGGAWRCVSLSIARFRYRAGNRAILQLELSLMGRGGDEVEVPGALWLYKGNKARDGAAEARACDQTPGGLPDMLYEPRTHGLVTLFPYDRRVPEIGQFMACPYGFSRVLTGSEPVSQPTLSRYRPGLGATFRWRTEGGTSFVKIFKDRPASLRHAELSDLWAGIRGKTLATPVPEGFDDTLGAVALRQADGTPFGECLASPDAREPAWAVDTVLSGLDSLNGLAITPRRSVDGDDLLGRGQSVVRLLRAVDPPMAVIAADALKTLAACQPTLRAHPVHMDMKIEHVLIDGTTACLLDMDSLALSDPLYDPAMLAARIELSGLEGTLPHDICAAAIDQLRAAARIERRPVFDWLHCIARFQTARFVLQNIRPNWSAHVNALMRRVTALTPDPAFSE